MVRKSVGELAEEVEGQDEGGGRWMMRLMVMKETLVEEDRIALIYFHRH